ncbi:hypothetical protein [Paenibacillus sp. OSY-SE]|uniref:hypothetical protein n=1 Tax=Paenibacillus sp. OSY-SE TaxID=1196323 RepID=UPI0002D75FD4|nr:hypothetical protein [Paenibacillus sp. OSY-SE]
MSDRLSFSRCLKTMMDITGLTARRLAHALHFEVSSVYKWMTGQRLPQQNNMTSLCHSIAAEIAGLIVPDSPMEDRIRPLLLCYAPEPEESHSSMPRKKQYEQWVEHALQHAYTLSKFSKRNHASWPFQANEADEASPFLAEADGHSIQPLHGTCHLPIGAEICCNSQSYHQALLDMLKEAGKAEDSADKQLVSIVRWGSDLLNEPEDMRKGLIRQLKQLSQQGWELGVGYIHDLYDEISYDSFKRLIAVYLECPEINYFMPNSNYKMVSIDRVTVISGVGALLSYNLQEQGFDLTIIVRNTEAVSQMLTYYRNVLKTFRRLIRTYDQDPAITTDAEHWNYLAGDMYLLTRTIPSIFMPDKLFERMLEHLKVPSFTNSRDELIHNMREKRALMLTQMSSYKFYCKLAKSSFIQFVRTGKMTLFGVDLCFSVQDRIECVKHIIHMLGYPTVNLLVYNLQDMEHKRVSRLILFEDNQLKVQLRVKPSGHKAFSGEENVHISIEDPFIVGLFKQRYLLNWDHADWKSKDKAHWIRWLEKHLAWLEDNKTTLDKLN